MRTEGQVWGIVNRERRKRRVNGDVKMEEWEEYFEGMLGESGLGRKGRRKRGGRRGAK